MNTILLQDKLAVLEQMVSLSGTIGLDLRDKYPEEKMKFKDLPGSNNTKNFALYSYFDRNYYLGNTNTVLIQSVYMRLGEVVGAQMLAWLGKAIEKELGFTIDELPRDLAQNARAVLDLSASTVRMIGTEWSNHLPGHLSDIDPAGPKLYLGVGYTYMTHPKNPELPIRGYFYVLAGLIEGLSQDADGNPTFTSDTPFIAQSGDIELLGDVYKQRQKDLSASGTTEG